LTKARAGAVRATTVRPHGEHNIFVSFIEEFRLWQKQGRIIAHIEVTHPGNHYPSEEIRIACRNTPGWRAFREKYNFKYVSAKTLEKVRQIAKKKFDIGG
jgi:hypothetical protein